jgi:hypothetical protein
VSDQLSPETEEILRRVREGERMPPAQRRRLKGAVLARIAFASTATLASGTAVATGMGAAAKTAVGLVVMASLGTGGYFTYRAVAAHRARVVAPLVSPVAAVEPVPAPAPEPPAAPVFIKAPTTTVSARTRRPPERHVAVAAVDPGTLAKETALLRQADAALRAGDTARAIALLDQHAARFPQGVLAPERTAERLIVLCQVGGADRGAVAQYLAAHPASPLTSRVRGACTPAR